MNLLLQRLADAAELGPGLGEGGGDGLPVPALGRLLHGGAELGEGMGAEVAGAALERMGRAGRERGIALGEPLFEALRAHRLGVAREQGVMPYVVASDRSLRELCVLKPKSLGELLDVYGFGETRAERYGPGLLAVVARFSR